MPNNMFDPADTDMPRPSALSNMMDPKDQPMQPPQSDAEHADNKQGWLDWFANPAVSNALLSFGANMLQPQYHQSVAGMIGQSIGAAGEAVGQVGTDVLARQKAAADIEETKAKTLATPVEAKAKQTEAEAAASKIPFLQENLDLKQQYLDQSLYLRSQLDQARQSNDYARVQLIQQQIDNLQQTTQENALKAKYPRLTEFRTAHDAWYKEYLTGTLGPGVKEPQPEDYGIDRTALGMSSTGAGAPTSPDRPFANMPPYNPKGSPQNVSNFWSAVMQLPPDQFKLVRWEYVHNRGPGAGGMSEEEWDAHTGAVAGVQPGGGPATPPGTKLTPPPLVGTKQAPGVQQPARGYRGLPASGQQ